MVLEHSNGSQSSEIFFKSCEIRSIFDCNYTFPIDLAANEISLGVELTRWHVFENYL